MKQLSVIVPHYNQPEKLKVLLDSIPQTASLEVIVIDDHSDSSSREAFNSLSQSYKWVTFLTVPDGEKGPGMARNLGIKMSSASWVLFADSDDYFVDNAFEIVDSYLESDADVVYFSPDSLFTDTHKSASRHVQFRKLVDDYVDTQDKDVFLKHYSPCSKLVSKRILTANDIRFDPGVGGEDVNFGLKLAYYSKKVLADQRVIYMITDSENSLTKKMSYTVLKNHFDGMCRYNDFLQLKDLNEHQAPMTGWVVRALSHSPVIMFKWLSMCIRKGYPFGLLFYVKKYLKKS